MARSLGAAGNDFLLKKAVNSNLPHAIGRGVERGVFSSADEAGAALRGLTEQMTGAEEKVCLSTVHRTPPLQVPATFNHSTNKDKTVVDF